VPLQVGALDPAFPSGGRADAIFVLCGRTLRKRTYPRVRERLDEEDLCTSATAICCPRTRSR
jgi:hypothetical protein